MSSPGAALPDAGTFFQTSANGSDNTQIAPELAATNQLPTAEEFFAPKGGGPIEGEANNTIWSSVKTEGARILNSIGYGIKQSWGSEPVGLSDQDEANMRAAGLFDDYKDGHRNFWKQTSEALLRPTLEASHALWNIGLRGPPALFMGAASGLRTAAQDIEGKNPTAVSQAEAFPFGAASEMIGAVPEGFGPEFGTVATEDAGITRVRQISRARSLGVVGEGEDGYMGTVAPKPETEIQRASAAKEIVEIQKEEPQPQPSAPPPDIHQIARQIDPDTFAEYDALSVRRDNYRQWLGGLSDQRAQLPEAQEFQSQIDTILGKVNGVEDRLTKSAQQRLDAARDGLDDFLRTDTPEMAAIRQDMMRTDYRMRDLAPSVAAAYRQAQEFAPSQPEAIAETASQAGELQAPSETVEAVPQGVPQPIGPANDNMVQNIANDVSRQLIAAGRPEEEASAASQLIAAHYAARAERFKGALGTAEELYARDAPQIKQGGTHAKEFAQGTTLHQGGVTDTPEFKNWFAESKVKDGNGQPSVVYHGTGADFEAFSHKAQYSGEGATQTGSGFYFTSSPESASRYADLATSKGGAGRVLPVYLSIKNPLHIDFSTGEVRGAAIRLTKKQVRDIIMSIPNIRSLEDSPLLNFGDIAYEGFNKVLNDAINSYAGGSNIAALRNDFFGNNHEAWLKALSEATGHDGAVTITMNGDTHWVAWKAEQIKSAIGNRGTFSNKSANILEQGRKGSLTLRDSRNVLKLFKSADASTFIHETGHQWLEEMMQDAANEKAPQDLRTDAKTVRDYLEIKEGEGVPRKAHEKFARSFERYIMEGRAPSKALADVFAKFRAWLTQIYQTVTRLRAPITDDIRDVFDRLLAAQPERQPIIAPDHEIASSMADIHEAEAESTAPEESHAVAENIRAEIDRMAAKEPEIAHGLQSATETARISGAHEVPTGAAVEAGPEPANETVPRPIGKEPAGGNQTPAKGASGIPADAEEYFRGPTSDRIDKAGNIRLDNLNTAEDVNDVIREASEKNDAFMDSRRGRISDGQVLDMAEALGVDPTPLLARKLGEAFNAEQIIYARKLLIQSAIEVRDKMILAASDAATDAEVMSYAEAKTRHNMIQSQVAGITAEAGRALRAFHSLEGGEEAKSIGDFLKDTTGRTLNQLRQEAKLGAQLKNASQVSKFVNDMAHGKLKNAIIEYWVNSLISGPFTHMRYSVGNAINALWRPLVEIPLAAGAHAIRGGEEGVYLGESGAQLYAMTKGARDGWRAAVDAFRSGYQTPLPGEKEFARPFGGTENAIPGRVGRILNVPSRSVGAIHSFFKVLRYEQNIQGLAYRTAREEGLVPGTSDFDLRVAKLTSNPTADMIDRAGNFLPERMEAAHLKNISGATADALRELYMAPYEYTSAMGHLTRAVNNSLVGKILIPFIKIGSQITRAAFVDRTPIGLFSRDIRENLAGVNGKGMQDLQAAKMTSGVALIGTTILMAAEGMATGDGPQDPKQRATWLLTHRPNTITVGDLTIPYQGLGWAGMLMRFSANAYEMSRDLPEETTGKMAVSVLEGLSDSVLDENFMRGMKDALDAMYHPAEYGAQYLQNFATNWLPFSVGLSQTAREIDPYWRDVRAPTWYEGLIKEMKSKVPLWSETLLPRRDMFGEPIPQSGLLPNYQSDPVVKALNDLQTGIARLQRKVRGVALTDQQYDDYSRVAGRLTKMNLDWLVRMPGWDELPAGLRLSAIQKAVRQSRDAAATDLMLKYQGTPNDIMEQAYKAKAQVLGIEDEGNN